MKRGIVEFSARQIVIVILAIIAFLALLALTQNILSTTLQPPQ